MLRIVLIVGALLALSQPAVAQVAWEGSAGVDYSTGTYGGSQDVTVVYAPIGLRAQSSRWRVEASAPYLYVNGPGSTLSGGVVIPGTGPATSNSGLGDVNLGGAIYLISPRPDGTSLEFGGTVKLPTAEATLGTGETDYSVQIAGRHPLGGQLSLFGSLGYQWLGDPVAYVLKDGPTATLGLAYAASAGTEIGVIGTYRAAYFDALDAQTQINPYISFRTSRGWSLTGYGTVGLSNASPDIGAGIMIGKPF